MSEASTSPLPDWAEHRLVLDARDGPEPVRYHVITTGRIEATDDERSTETGGAFGHADGTLATSRHEYHFEGRLLSVKVRPSLIDLRVRDHRDAPFEIGVDGEPIDFERWDPSRGDLPMGYGGPGALPEDVALDAEDCDRIASDREELLAASEDLGNGAVLGIDADIHLPEEPKTSVSFPQDDLAVVGLPTDEGSHPVLYREEMPDGWGHVGLRLGGDRAAVMNLRLRGSLDHYVPHDEYDSRLKGLSLAGDDQVAVNCRGWHWSHAAFTARGAGETFLCIDAHHNMGGGLGYGFNAGGPIPSKDWEDGEVWSDEEVTTFRPWHRRTEIKRVVTDANRHDVAAGRNASYEVRWFVTGPTAVAGHRIDMHRPGGGTITVGQGIVEESTRGVTSDGENGVVIRGWPVVGARIENVWFTWGEEPSAENRVEESNAPIIQTNAKADFRNLRRVYDHANEPFIRVSWDDCAFGPDEPAWITEELRRARGTLPERWDVGDP